MIRRHKIIMWKKPNDMNNKQMTDIAFKILSTLDLYGFSLNPTYLPGNSLDEIRSFDLSYDNLSDLIEKSVISENGTAYPELGRTISFFSSFDNDNCSKISLTIGGSAATFPNSLIVELPKNRDWFFVSKNNFYNLFEELISVFSPYYAFVTDNTSSNGYWNTEKHIPITIHWLNYFSHDIVENLNHKIMSQCDNFREFTDGYILKIFDNPFDKNVFNHIDKQKYFSNLLGIS